ncbi:hypothetical protein [Paludisphaera sp.]|uniref:hypothetical protein n=1 Tax=Paludisphaera sp. TaxID=2017432 RepID=UPI00301C81CA
MKAARFAAPLAAIATLLGADLHAQEAKTETQTIEARGLKLQVPATWEKVGSTSQMRAAQLKVKPAEGDDYPAEMVVFVFPGGAGGVDDNINRWRNMFKDEDGKAPKMETRKVASKSGEATRCETSGHYHPSRFPGLPAEPDRPGARLLGAILLTDDAGYFIRMVGPDKTMKGLADDFDAMVKSLEVAK